MDYKYIALSLGVVSIFTAQAEISLRFWLDELNRNSRPYYGNQLSLLVKFGKKLQTDKKLKKNIMDAIQFLRWTTVILAIGALICGAV